MMFSQYKPKVLLLFLIICALLAGFYLPSVIQTVVQAQPSTANNVDLSTYCALSTQACEQNQVIITLGKDVAKPLEETTIIVDNWQQSAQTLMLTLRGLEMDLGIVKFPLLLQENGQYKGMITLPVCIEDAMTWVGTITDENHHTVYTSIRMEK